MMISKTIKSKKILVSALTLFLIFISTLFLFKENLLLAVGSVLVRGDTIQASDAIIVLAGDISGERMESAIDLYKRGFAKKIIFWAGRAYWKFSEGDLILQQLSKAGINKESVIWSNKSLKEISTRGEAYENLRTMLSNNIKSFILVTSPYHTRRAYYVYHELAKDKDIKFYTFPSKHTPFSMKDWWKSREGRKTIYMEWNKLIYFTFVEEN